MPQNCEIIFQHFGYVYLRAQIRKTTTATTVTQLPPFARKSQQRIPYSEHKLLGSFLTCRSSEPSNLLLRKRPSDSASSNAILSAFRNKQAKEPLKAHNWKQHTRCYSIYYNTHLVRRQIHSFAVSKRTHTNTKNNAPTKSWYGRYHSAKMSAKPPTHRLTLYCIIFCNWLQLQKSSLIIQTRAQ